MVANANPCAILLGGGVTALPVARSLARAGVPVIALGRSGDPVQRSRAVERFVDLGGGEPAQQRWRAWLEQAPSGSVVLPCEDDGLELVARHRAELEALGLIPIEADDEVLLAMLDKEQTSALAREHGIPAPRTLRISRQSDLAAAAQAIGFPSALKPLASHRSKLFFREKAFVVSDLGELCQAFDRVSAAGIEVLLTEIVPGPDAGHQSYYSYLDGDGQPLFHFTKRKPRQDPPGFGAGCFHETRWIPEVAELGLAFFQRVGVRGLANVEFKRDARDGELKLIECNHRFTASMALIHASGCDMALFTYNRLLGRPLPRAWPYRERHVLWCPREDVRAFRHYRRSGELSTATWMRSLVRPMHFRVASWRDPAPVVEAVARAAVSRARRVGRGSGDVEQAPKHPLGGAD